MHSGDATLVLPPQRTYLETMRRIRRIAARDRRARCSINGPFNIQFLAKDNDVKVIECNLRASRSFPFVSKVCSVNFIDVAAAGDDGPAGRGAVTASVHRPRLRRRQGAAVLASRAWKAPTRSSASRWPRPARSAASATTSRRRSSRRCSRSAIRLPIRSVLLSTGPIEGKAAFLESARDAARRWAWSSTRTRGTAAFLAGNGIDASVSVTGRSSTGRRTRSS